MKTVAILPARYGSTRFPGKALALLCGKPMIQHVYERTCQASLVDQVLVATDDKRIYDVITAQGGIAVMTSPDHETGTDRLAEVAAKLDADVIVNVQGDEPLIDPAVIDLALRPFQEQSGVMMSTLDAPITSIDDYFSPNVVKVVTDLQGNALYFSRAPIPLVRDCTALTQAAIDDGTIKANRHIGLYAFQRQCLLRYAALAQTPLETTEKLEQLRALENGIAIRVLMTDHVAVGVDTPEDLQRAEALMQADDGRKRI